METGKYWVANPQPGEKGFSEFWCKVEPGISTIHAIREGIEFQMRAFIPWDADIEIWTLSFRNMEKKVRHLAIYPVVEFPTRRIHWYFSAVYLPEVQAIHFVDSDYQSPRGAFFACDREVSGYETSSRRFYGYLNDRLHPAGIEMGLSNKPAENEWCVGVLETRVTLKPGGSLSFNVFTGRALEKKVVRKELKKFRKAGTVEKSVRKIYQYWESLRKRVQVSLPDRTMQIALNCWVPYCVDITTRFRQQTKIGYRDILQYARGYMALNPERSREMLLTALRYQYKAGNAPRAFLPDHSGIDARDARDGVSWIADTLCAYIKETGDRGVLEEVVPYYDNKKGGTVWEHAKRAVEFLYYNRGRHKMCLVGGGDWNDALQLGGGKGRGESVWLTIATCRALRITAEIARYAGETDTAKKFERWRKELADDINRYAWDGGWYVYGFTDDGRPCGTHVEKEGAIYANVQTWALMEKIVPPERTKMLWKNIEDYLCTDAGILVLHPAYTVYRPEIGRISAMPKGAYENASAYVHGTAFLIAAYAANGMGEQAVKYWRIAHPTNPLNPHSGCEPYACCSYYTGPASQYFGYGPNSWFTGSVSWLFFQALEAILGIQPDFDGLRVNPVIPAEWKEYAVTRQFRNATYNIIVKNPHHAVSGVKEVSVDGKRLESNLIPSADGGIHEVEVVMGK
jgi:cellobiose phosphorylase